MSVMIFLQLLTKVKLFQLKKIFDDSAMKCDMKHDIKSSTKRRKYRNKSWFTKICEEKRRKYFKAKTQSGNKLTVDNIGKTKKACKEYKKCQSQSEAVIFYALWSLKNCSFGLTLMM